eukprot:TRINITY_DN5389_c0_g1_i4.p1 TRINITY_DN5389_c0_g1~~TRINITY_DN5389_c0_g1_i4.p1  ORF type:complete len:156 (-),score=26.50 TRINITY_DN5389_c0_g1_i4:99-527(-)
MTTEWHRPLARAASHLRHVWQQEPLVFFSGETILKGKLSLPEVAPLIDSGVLPAGSAEVGGAGDWRSVPLGGPVSKVLPNRTVYANNAGMYLPKLAELCVATVDTLDWPSSCNCYMSSPGLQVLGSYGPSLASLRTPSLPND